LVRGVASGASGWVYEDGTGDKIAGEVWSGGMWVRFGTAVTVTPRMSFVAADTTTLVGTKTAAPVAVPANTWTYVTVNEVTSTASYATMQFWAQVAGVVADNSFYDATNLIFEKVAAVGTYFDGSFPGTPTYLYAWLGLENSSQSTLSARGVL
jgi:hypothetical protein